MDNGTMTREQALYKLATVIMKNESAEAEAVKGYTEQLAAIDCARQFAANENDLTEFLDRLEAATSEKNSRRAFARRIALQGVCRAYRHNPPRRTKA